MAPEDIESVTTHLVRTDKHDPATNEEAVALWRITLKDADERKVKGASSAINKLALATIPGLFAVAGMGVAKPFGVYRPAVVPADLVPQHVVVLGGARTVVDSVAPAADVVVGAASVDVPEVPGSRCPSPSAGLRRPLATRAATPTWGIRSVGRCVRLLVEPTGAPATAARPPTCGALELPNIWSVNFVIHGLLRRASPRRPPDGQAKGLGEWPPGSWTCRAGRRVSPAMWPAPVPDRVGVNMASRGRFTPSRSDWADHDADLT